MIKKLVQAPSAILRKKSVLVNIIDTNIKSKAVDMIDTALDWEKGQKYWKSAAIAANQIGYQEAIVAIRDDSSEGMSIYYNPRIVWKNNKKIKSHEGCLSVAKCSGIVYRASSVRVEALNNKGEKININAHGFASIVWQHEIDHLNGKVFYDHVKSDDQMGFIDEKGRFVIDKSIRPSLLKAETDLKKKI